MLSPRKNSSTVNTHLYSLHINYQVSTNNDINIGWKLRKTKAPWLITLILGIVSLIAGIILLVNPAERANAVMIWSGIILLINSITSCIDKFIFKKYVKDIKKATKNFIKSFDEN